MNTLQSSTEGLWPVRVGGEYRPLDVEGKPTPSVRSRVTFLHDGFVHFDFISELSKQVIFAGKCTTLAFCQTRVPGDIATVPSLYAALEFAKAALNHKDLSDEARANTLAIIQKALDTKEVSC